ncbi:MAG: ABC transporter permease subunit [Candidatus Acetothermia bacterium]|jgi:NitT/TauT family transport system permease protein|nr:ABC transporter permease subunit [Candidatus Acetothermia bacterium]MDH7505072.1 ABC transporter permease subunit [Candidatus Acetothermia bacterium]
MSARRKLSYYLLGVLILVALWFLGSLIMEWVFSDEPAKARAFPDPIMAFKAVYSSWSELGRNLLSSGLRVLLGLLLAIVFAAPLGLVIGHEEALDRIFSPIIYITFPIPKIVFLPLLFVLFGLSELSIVLTIALIVAFQTLLAARDAARNVPQDYVLSVRSAGANKWQLYRHVIIPASLPEVLASVRISIGIAIAALYLAETTGVNSGLGYFLLSARRQFSFEALFAGIMVMGLLGLVLYGLLDLLERLLCRWKHL